MPRQVFVVYFLLLLFVCCQLCERGCAVYNAQVHIDADGKLIDDILKPDDTKIKEKLESLKQTNYKVEHIELISLVAANEVIFAMAEMNYTDNSDKNIAVLAKYFETTGGSWGNEAFKEKGGNWNLELVTKKVEKINNHAVIKSFAVATKENKIYHITISNSTLVENGPPVLSPSPAPEWHVRVVEGTVTNGSEITKKEIKLESLKISKFTYNPESEKKLNTKPEKLPPSDGFAFVTDENNIFFFMKGKTNDGNKNVVAVFEFNIDGSKKLELLPANFPVECYPSFFQWNKEIIMAPSICPNKESHNVKVFNKDDKRFNDSSKPIARLRDFLKDKNNFTTAEIEGKNVLFCTQQKDLNGEDSGKNNVYLWISDGTHVGKAGTIIEKIEGTFYGSVLYTKEELIALHQKYNTWQ